MALAKYDGVLAAETGPDAGYIGNVDAVAETLTGTSAAESIWGGAGDVLKGGAGNDIYWLQADRSLITVIEKPGEGIDTIAGWQSLSLEHFPNIENVRVENHNTYGAGNGLDNIIQGGAGSQQLYGGGGQDVLIGGGGADTFIVKKGEGNDVIQDFNAGEDKVRLSAGFTSFDQVKAHMTQVGADVKLDLGGGDGLMFRNITVGQFTAANFQLQLDVGSLGAQTFGDDFNTLSLWDPESNPTGTWRPDFGYQGTQGVGSYTLVSNNEKQIYTSPYFRDHNGDFSETPFVTNADGTLSIWAKPSANSEIFGYGYTSGMITTQPTFAQTYGYFEMRADLPSAQGAWPAFWLIPADGSWPPELDIMETLTFDDNATWTTQHSGLGGHSADGQLSYIPDTADGFHTYGALWTPENLIWYIDGVEVFRSATPADMNKPMFMIANLALGGWGGAIAGGQLPAEFKIDYIRAYALPGSSSASGSGGNTGGAQEPPPAADPVGVTLSCAFAGDTLTGTAGADTLNASQGADKLTGGAGADVFKFAAMPWSRGHVTDFQVGVDKLDISALYLGGYAGTDPVADGYVRFESDGHGGTLVMLDIDGHGSANPWAFQVAVLDGVSPTGLTAAQVFGGPAAPPPVVAPPPPPPPPANPAGLVLTSAFAGDTLTGSGGADTLNASQGADKLTGGAGADVFKFAALPWSRGHITDFQVGVDKLDVSALYMNGYSGSDPVADGYVRFESDGQGGTVVMLDIDAGGSANPWAFQIAVLDGVSPVGLTAAQVFDGPATAAVTPPPPAATPGVVLTSSIYADTLTGGAGADTLNAGQGPDKLTGGAGADHFTFDKLVWNPGHITDFQHGVDVLDLRALFTAAGYGGNDPVADGYLRLESDGMGGTKVAFDQDGWGSANPWPTTLTTLDNVAPSSLTSSDWLFH